MHWPRALVVWLLIALAESLHGVLRTLLVTPVLGDLAARQLGVLIGSGLIFAISVATVRWMGARTLRQQLGIGTAWAALMLAFEIGLGIALGLDAARLTADYDPGRGGYMAFGMAFLVAAPALAARARQVRSRGHGLRRAAWLAAGFAVLVAAAWVVLAFQRDLRAAEARISGISRIAVTACGPIEYVSVGDGPTLLAVHGAGGGFDQVLGALQPLTGAGLRVIAMSRFGYLGTPLPVDASAAAQADAHACLLDALGIDRAAVLGASAGAPSALLFAERHPQRATALVLLVPALYVPRQGGEAPVSVPPGTRALFATALRFDFLFWAAPRLARDAVLRGILATPPAVVAAASPAEQARVAQMIRQILPVRPRRQGMLNDAAVLADIGRYDLESITTPTLLISAEDDLFGTCAIARYTAEHLPDARLVSYASGGHLWVGHHDAVLAEIVAFLRSPAIEPEVPGA